MEFTLSVIKAKKAYKKISKVALDLCLAVLTMSIGQRADTMKEVNRSRCECRHNFKVASSFSAAP